MYVLLCALRFMQDGLLLSLRSSCVSKRAGGVDTFLFPCVAACEAAWVGAK